MVDDLAEAVDQGRLEAEGKCDLLRLVIPQPDHRVGVALDDLLRGFLGDGLDLDATLGAGHHHDLARGPVHDDAEVELPGDVRALGDQDLVHGMALDVHPQNCFSGRARFFRRLHDLDTACLAAAAGVHLRLDDDGTAELPCDLLGLIRSRGDLTGVDGNTMLREEFCRLVLMNVHRPRCSFCWQDVSAGTAQAGCRATEAPLNCLFALVIVAQKGLVPGRPGRCSGGPEGPSTYQADRRAPVISWMRVRAWRSVNELCPRYSLFDVSSVILRPTETFPIGCARKGRVNIVSFRVPSVRVRLDDLFLCCVGGTTPAREVQAET